MKKQIFKLTSILLAMVMVFTMFTIVPISAEEATVNLSDAVANLKTAWKNLDYAKTTEECGVNYAAGWLGGTVDEKTVTFADAAQLIMWGTQTNSNYMNNLRLFENKISDIEDIYFYYSSNGDITTQVNSVLNNGTAYEIRNFSATVVLENTNNVMTKVYLSDYLAKVNNSTIDSIYVKPYAGTHDYFLRFGFNYTAAAGTTLTLGKIYAEVDQNLLNTDSLTDSQWYDKAVAVDTDALKADYNDEIGSDEWQAFLAAREAVLACSGEVLKARALDTLRTEWVKMVESVPTLNSNYSHYYFWDASVNKLSCSTVATDKYGNAYTATGVASTDTEYGAVNGNTAANLLLYQTASNITIDNAVDVGFWYKSTGDINVRTYMMFGSSTTASNSAATGVFNGDGEWHFYSLRTAMGDTAWNDVTNTYKATKFYRYYIDLGNVVDDVLTSVDVTFGGVAFRYKDTTVAAIDDADLVARAAVFDTTAYTDTAAFDAALAAALEFYPDIANEIAVARLDTAWQNLVPYYSKASLGVVGGSWITYDESYRVADAPEELGENAVSYKVSATANPGGASDVGAKNPSNQKFNEIAWTNEPGSLNASTYLTDIKKADIEDLYFYYKSSARIYARPGLAYTNGTSINPGLSASFGDGYVLPASDGEWRKVSFKDFVCNPQNTTYTATNWTNRFASSAGYEYLARVTLQVSAASDTNQDVLFSDIFVKYGSDKNREGSSEWTDKEIVKNALLLGDDAVDAGYLNTAEWQAFLSARANALTFYPEVEEEAAKINAIPTLRNAWKAMTYIPQKVNTAPIGAYSTGGSSTQIPIFNESMADVRNSYIDSEITGYGTAFNFPAVDFKDSNGASTSYEWFIWRNHGVKLFSKSDIEYIGFWYNSSVAITPVRILFNGGNQVDGGTLPATDGWKFITLKEIMGETKWNNVLNNAAISDVSDIRMMFTHGTQRSTEIYFGDLEIYSRDTQIIDIDNLSATALIKKADATNLGVYENGAAKDAFVAAVAAAKTCYATELEAAAIKDAALTLNNELFMKPATVINPWREDDPDSAKSNATVFGTSNNGDYYTTVNTAVIGNASCAPDTGAVMYETDTPVLLKDIEDITFSYKVENKNDNVLTVARIWFYEENYTRYEKDEEGNIVYEEDGETPVVIANNWKTGMEAYGTTRYLAFDANTDGWVETSLATIFGDNWKTVYLGFLNGSDIKEVDFTEENTYISKMSFGFNTKEGASADVSVGSMYIKKTDASAYTITADDADFEGVLAEARAINLDNVNIAKANEFKKLVKAFETKIGAEVKAGYIAGNWYEDGLTLKDLSVLSRKNDSTLGDTFCDDDAIGDLTEESIRKSLLGIQ